MVFFVCFRGSHKSNNTQAPLPPIKYNWESFANDYLVSKVLYLHHSYSIVLYKSNSVSSYVAPNKYYLG